jgi:arylsulfatase A-like enzyme
MQEITRRAFLNGAGATVALGLTCGCMGIAPTRRPNVVLITTDDQGYGDVGFHGNHEIRTPHLDRLARESVELTHFYTQPVCAPTRASLLTGRYNYRTGVVDTYLGRAMMHSDEVTLAEILSASGYRTGIFGKWHLGDSYPLRAMDQGFQESLVHRGGGIGQPSDPPGGDHYQDPWLVHNGKDGRFQGYCTDVFTDAALEFMQANRDRPFFAYLSTNAPHTPLEVPESYVVPYREMGLDETTAKVYGMITNVDENVGRLLAKLDEWQLAENTIVIFMTDNGAQQHRYRAGLRGLKGSVYEGGIRVPFLVRWPARFKPGKVEVPAAHIDVLPTLLEVCGAARPTDLQLDGRTLLPLLDGSRSDWPDRNLFFQWHRGDEPQLYRAFAARDKRYKLVGHLDGDGSPGFELFDLETDPGEQRDLTTHHPEIAGRLRQAYEEWFKDVSSTRGYAPPRIILGTDHENPVLLTRQDWRGARASWSDDGLGHWEVAVARAGNYQVRLIFPAAKEAGRVEFRLGSCRREGEIKVGDTSVLFEAVQLEQGDGRLQAVLHSGSASRGAHYVEVRR